MSDQGCACMATVMRIEGHLRGFDGCHTERQLRILQELEQRVYQAIDSARYSNEKETP